MSTVKGVFGMAFYMGHVPGLANGIKSYCLPGEME